MNRDASRHRFDRRWWALVPLALAATLATACDSSGSNPTTPDSGPYTISFSLDASFQGPHGGQPITIAVIRSSDGFVIASGNSTVSPSLDPAYSFAPGQVLERGLDYEVHYWIDSNEGGGARGVCDPRPIDHQASVEFYAASNHINWATTHNDALNEDVCDTFE